MPLAGITNQFDSHSLAVERRKVLLGIYQGRLSTRSSTMRRPLPVSVLLLAVISCSSKSGPPKDSARPAAALATPTSPASAAATGDSTQDDGHRAGLTFVDYPQ